MKVKVKVLSKKTLNRRYSKLSNTRMAKLTRQAIEKGYSIVLVESTNFRCKEDLIHEVKPALEGLFPSSKIELCGATDMSELHKGKLYCAFRKNDRINSIDMTHH